jgi:hypothetical protein
MTANQIAYWNLQEQKRANREKEQENVRSNKAKELNQLIGNLDSIENWAAYLGLDDTADLQKIFKVLNKSIFADTPIGGFIEGMSSNLAKPQGQTNIENRVPNPVNPNLSGIYAEPNLMPGGAKSPWN